MDDWIFAVGLNDPDLRKCRETLKGHEKRGPSSNDVSFEELNRARFNIDDGFHLFVCTHPQCGKCRVVLKSEIPFLTNEERDPSRFQCNALVGFCLPSVPRDVDVNQCI